MLRPARQSDFDDIFAIYMSPQVNPFMSWEPMNRETFQAIYTQLLTTEFLFAYEVNQIFAAVIRVERMKHRRSHVAYIGGLGVAPNFQNQGLGTRILKEVIENLTNDGIKRIELIVESDNPRAIGLYEKLGFKIEGTMKNYFKRQGQNHYTDDHMMALLLS